MRSVFFGICTYECAMFLFHLNTNECLQARHSTYLKARYVDESIHALQNKTKSLVLHIDQVQISELWILAEDLLRHFAHVRLHIRISGQTLCKPREKRTRSTVIVASVCVTVPYPKFIITRVDQVQSMPNLRDSRTPVV